MGSDKKRATTGTLTRDGELPLPVRSFKDPPILSEIISSDLDESKESIFWCRKRGFPPFGRRLASLFLKGESMKTVFPDVGQSYKTEIYLPVGAQDAHGYNY